MKQRKLISSLVHTLLISMSVFTYSSALANAPTEDPLYKNYTGGDDKNLLSQVHCNNTDGNDSLDCLMAGYGMSLRGMLFLPAYNQDRIMAAGSILSTILSPKYQAYATSMASQSVQSAMLLANPGDAANSFLLSVPNYLGKTEDNKPIVLTPDFIKTATVYNTINAVNPTPFNLPTFFSTLNVSPMDIQNAVNTTNFDSVIAPMTYKEGNTVTADAFIKYVTGLASPMPTPDFSKAVRPEGSMYPSLDYYLVKLLTNSTVQDYLTSLRNYTSQLSVGISNFYYLYHERMPITDPTALGKAIAIMTPPPGSIAAAAQEGQPVDIPTAVSPLQAMQYIATSRVGNSAWYEAAQNAAPATLLRESLYVLAEIPPMLFQLHLDLERILATLSAMQIQQANGNRIMLETKREKVVQILTSPEKETSETASAAAAATDDLSQADIEDAKKRLKERENSNPTTSP